MYYNTIKILLTFYCLTLQKYERALKMESNIKIVFFDAVNPQFYKFHIGLEPVDLIFASILSHFLLVQMFNREIITVIMQHVFKLKNDTT